MTPLPIPLRYNGTGFDLLPRFQSLADKHYTIGEVTLMAAQEERSEVSHRHEFAWLREAWASLPENLGEAYPTAEHLRKAMLIKTGWCNVTDYACSSRAEAIRWAANLRREADEYTVVIVSEAVVRVMKPRSQARGKMKAADFQASKTAVLEAVAALLEVSPSVLEKQGAEA